MIRLSLFLPFLYNFAPKYLQVMNRLKKENEYISTLLAFALVPISGFAMDVYLPSFPKMATALNASAADIKLTLTIFLVSYGLSQLFVGSISDSFGRYRLTVFSLIIFILTCVGIVATHDLHLIIALRFIQGIAISLIVVCKRAFFIDVYEGNKRKHYTSMLTVVWSTAPIIAPFLGGFLQNSFGWQSNFYFLGLYGLIMLLLELRYSGETIIHKQPFRFSDNFAVYKNLLQSTDFSLGIIVLGLSYSMVMIFGMSIPFIVEDVYRLSPLYSGYCALISGVAIFCGGLYSKTLLHKPVYKKLQLANTCQLFIVTVMLTTAVYFTQLLQMMVFVFLIHFWQGFTYNTYFTYSLTRHPKYAATSSGLASGGSYIVFSMASYLVANVISIQNQWTLGISYLIFILAIQCLLFFVKAKLNAFESSRAEE